MSVGTGVPDAVPDATVAAGHVVRRVVLRSGPTPEPDPGTTELVAALGRRLHSLADALRAGMDTVDRAGLDRSRLQQLATVDDLVARLARYCDSLLVLGGVSAVRLRGEPVELLTVLGAAATTVEQHTRIAFGPVAEGVAVSGHAAPTLIHAVGELLDNATYFSPPDSLVTVSAYRVPGQVLVRVVDRGLGIPPARLAWLNLRMTVPGVPGPDTVRTTGLAVVGTLAHRHGLTVRLAAGRRCGTVAEVGIPDQILVYGQARSATTGPPRAGAAQVAAVRGIPAPGAAAALATLRGVARDDGKSTPLCQTTAAETREYRR